MTEELINELKKSKHFKENLDAFEKWVLVSEEVCPCGYEMTRRYKKKR